MELLQLVVSGGDAGKVVNKLGCRGQDEGAAVFGLAQALFEELRYDDGVLLNGEALLYRVPLAEDIPPALFLHYPGTGPWGGRTFWDQGGWAKGGHASHCPSDCPSHR